MLLGLFHERALQKVTVRFISHLQSLQSCQVRLTGVYSCGTIQVALVRTEAGQTSPNISYAALQAVVFLVYCRFKTEEMFKRAVIYLVKTSSEFFPFSLAFCSKSAIFLLFILRSLKKSLCCEKICSCLFFCYVAFE